MSLCYCKTDFALLPSEVITAESVNSELTTKRTYLSLFLSWFEHHCHVILELLSCLEQIYCDKPLELIDNRSTEWLPNTNIVHAVQTNSEYSLCTPTGQVCDALVKTSLTPDQDLDYSLPKICKKNTLNLCFVFWIQWLESSQYISSCNAAESDSCVYYVMGFPKHHVMSWKCSHSG